MGERDRGLKGPAIEDGGELAIAPHALEIGESSARRDQCRQCHRVEVARCPVSHFIESSTMCRFLGLSCLLLLPSALGAQQPQRPRLEQRAAVQAGMIRGMAAVSVHGETPAPVSPWAARRRSARG